jgi:hypothetical protein
MKRLELKKIRLLTSAATGQIRLRSIVAARKIRATICPTACGKGN